MRSDSLAIGFAILALTLGTIGCASDGKDTADIDDSMSGSRGTGTEFDDGSAGAGIGTSRQLHELETVYFAYDRSDITSQSASALRENAAKIKNNTTWGRVIVQGNTDERGSEEYNLALGERRAMAVKRYLVDLGVPDSRLGTVSFGEAKPAVPGHDESAYRYNRRSDFASN